MRYALILRLAVLATCAGAEISAQVAKPWRDATEPYGARVATTGGAVCTDCVAIRRTAVLGESEGDGYIENNTASIVRDGQGRFWVLQSDGVKVFGPDGKYVRQLGRKGGGPLEFAYPSAILAGRDGRVHVFDPGNDRETILDETFDLVGERRPPGRVLAVAELPGEDRYVANMHTSSSGPMAPPLFLVQGIDTIASFGRPEVRGSASIYRVIAVDRLGWIYTSRRYEYAVDIWRPDGTHFGRIERPGLWPPVPHEEPGKRAPRQPVRGIVTGLRVDASDHLWVVTLVLKSPDGPPPRSIDAFKTLIEVINLPTGQLVARAEPNALVYGFLGDSLMVGPSETEKGEPQEVVWALRARLP